MSILDISIIQGGGGGWVLTVEQIPRQLADLFLDIWSNPLVLLLLANVILLIAGTFLESIAAIL